MKKIYEVKYSGGSYDDYYTYSIFVTNSKSKAAKYVTKFNKVLKNCRKYYKQFEDRTYGSGWMNEKRIAQNYARWNIVRSVNNSYWNEIGVR